MANFSDRRDARVIAGCEEHLATHNCRILNEGVGRWVFDIGLEQGDLARQSLNAEFVDLPKQFRNKRLLRGKNSKLAFKRAVPLHRHAAHDLALALRRRFTLDSFRDRCE